MGPRLSLEELWKAWGKAQGAKGGFCPPSARPLPPHTQAAGTEDPSLVPTLPTVAGLRASCPGQQDPARLVPASPAWARPSAPASSIARRQTGSHWDRAPTSCASTEKGSREHSQGQLPQPHPGFGAASRGRVGPTRDSSGGRSRANTTARTRQPLRRLFPPPGLCPAQWRFCDHHREADGRQAHKVGGGGP